MLRTMQAPYRLISLRVPLEGVNPHLQTVETVFPNANWFERELWDMFGIYFDGHSDMRRIIMPYDWEGHPLRKDYPLGYEEVQFTFNFDEVMTRKPRPKEVVVLRAALCPRYAIPGIGPRMAKRTHGCPRAVLNQRPGKMLKRRKMQELVINGWL